MSSSTLQPHRNAATQPPLMVPDDLIDPTRAAALRFSRFPVVDAAARSLAVAIVDQYVTRAWLDKLTLNRDMPRAVLTALAHASRQLEERVLLIPWHSVLLVDLPTVLGNHYAAFAGARAAVAVSSSTVLHQPTPVAHGVPIQGSTGMGVGGRANKPSGIASHATQTTGLSPSVASHSSTSSNRPTQSNLITPATPRLNGPPQFTAQSGSSASLAPATLPSTPTQLQPSPFPSKTTPAAAASPGWPTASTPIDQFTPTDAKFALLMPHIALEPDPASFANSSSNSSSPSPPSAALPAFNDYLRTVASVLLDAFLPTCTLEADAERLLMRDIVAGVLGMVVEAMSDPVMLLRAITAAFEASSSSQPPASHSSSPPSSTRQPTSTPPPASSDVPPSSKLSTSHSQAHTPTYPPSPLHLTFSSATLHSHWARLLSASQWTWYQATLLWHTFTQRLRSSSSSSTSRAPESTSPWIRLPSSGRPPGHRHLVHQADAILFTTLDHLLHLTHNPATRPWTLLWHLWVRPPIRFLFGTWVDTYLHVAVMYPWNAQMVARMVEWVTENVVLKPPTAGEAGASTGGGPLPPSPPPDMHQLLVQCVDAIVLATGTPALRPVLTDHTLRALASQYRNRQLVVRVVDVLVAQIVAAGARAAAAAANAGSRAGGYQGGAGSSSSPGADALLLTGRRRGGMARYGVATTSGYHRQHHSVSGSVVSGGGSGGGLSAAQGGLRRSSDVGSAAVSPSPGASGGVSALLASSATATATATSVVASMATTASSAATSSAAAAAMRHRRSRSTGGSSNLGSTTRLSSSAATTSSLARASGPVPSAIGRRQSVTAELVYREAGPFPPVPPLPRAASVGPVGSMNAGGSPRVLDGDRRRRRGE